MTIDGTIHKKFWLRAFINKNALDLKTDDTCINSVHWWPMRLNYSMNACYILQDELRNEINE